MAGYVRQRNAEIANGNLANASHVAEEFNQLQTAFNSSTGHNHSGAIGEGVPITVVGPAQDLVVSVSTVQPKTNNALSLGTSSLRFSNIHTNGLTLGGTAVTATAAELNILDGVTSTAAELNILDGVTATAAELNILDGVTATALEINVLDGITSSTAELNILDGVTATAAELNFVDGVTSNIQTQLNTKAPIAGPTFTGTATFPSVDINGGNVDGTAIGATTPAAGAFTTLTFGGTTVTSTATELNVLDGITATTAELNYTDGVTSNIQTQLDGKQPIDSDLTALAAISSNGLLARTGTGAATVRTITGTANQILVSDGNGVSGNPTISASIASQAEAEAGTDSTKLMTSQRVAQAIDTQATPIPTFTVETPTVSGTEVTITGIPSTAREIEIYLRDTSVSSSEHLLVQLRVGGAAVTTGYVGVSSNRGAVHSSTSGFPMISGATSAPFNGIMRIIRTATNTWVSSHSMSRGTVDHASGGGNIILAGAVDGITLTRTAASGNFDNGNMVVMWR